MPSVSTLLTKYSLYWTSFIYDQKYVLDSVQHLQKMGLTIMHCLLLVESPPRHRNALCEICHRAIGKCDGSFYTYDYSWCGSLNVYVLLAKINQHTVAYIVYTPVTTVMGYFCIWHKLDTFVSLMNCIYSVKC